MGLRAGAQLGQDECSRVACRAAQLYAEALTPRGRLPMLLLRNSESGVEGSEA